jgi:predicted ATPase
MRADLPTGTVTFLFTDIEGSTRLLSELGAENYARALAEHRRVLRGAFERHGGVEVDTQGDAFSVAFPTAPGALRAAGEGQRDLGLPVRMGLHTGTPLLTGEGYVGADVHRAARIAAAGHGRQVLVSATTAALADGGELLDLGEHRLKDFDTPMPIYQLGDGEFPPLRTISNTNLPRPTSSFVGREREVGEVTDLLRNGSRLVTLTGPGGSGKTRLAIESAAEFVGEVTAGVFWVGLASLRESGLVMQAVARTLGAKEDLAAHIGDRELLVLLDNLEQVIEVAPELAGLVEACPNVRLVVTSRELLRVRGEVEYEVLPLAEPDAVELFCARAQVESSRVVEELCQRLDNLPLALELAAARVKVLSPDGILQRLSQRLDLLKGGRDADPRQATLRTTIEWSHDLLDGQEQHLFRQLGVFAGSFDLEGAETVANADLDTVAALVDKNLLRRTEDGRFFMLETIHEFAAEQLELSGDDRIRDRHANYVVERAAEPARSERTIWIEAIGRSYGDFRSALEWLQERDVEGRFTTLVCRLADYWDSVGDLAEARRWIEAMLSTSTVVSAERIHARNLLSQALRLQAALPEARSQNDLAQAEAEALEEIFQLADAKAHRGAIEYADEKLEVARTYYEVAITLLEQTDDKGLVPALRHDLGLIALSEGDLLRARALLEQALEEAVRNGYSGIEANALGSLGYVAVSEGRPDEALERFRDEFTRLDVASRNHGMTAAIDAYGIAAALSARGEIERARILVAAVDAHFARIGAVPEVVPASAREAVVSAAADRLSASDVEAACATGAALPFEEAVAEALIPTDANAVDQPALS